MALALATSECSQVAPRAVPEGTQTDGVRVSWSIVLPRAPAGPSLKMTAGIPRRWTGTVLCMSSPVGSAAFSSRSNLAASALMSAFMSSDYARKGTEGTLSVELGRHLFDEQLGVRDQVGHLHLVARQPIVDRDPDPATSLLDIQVCAGNSERKDAIIAELAHRWDLLDRIPGAAQPLGERRARLTDERVLLALTVPTIIWAPLEVGELPATSQEQWSGPDIVTLKCAASISAVTCERVNREQAVFVN